MCGGSQKSFHCTKTFNYCEIITKMVHKEPQKMLPKIHRLETVISPASFDTSHRGNS